MPSGTSPDPFVSLSVALTGFTQVELAETGSAPTYRDWLEQSFATLFAELLGLWEQIERQNPEPASREAALRRDVLADPRLGPFARNISLLWYTAGWAELPAEWAKEHDQPQVPSRVFAMAYPQALAWKAAGTHPIGANPPGFGSWALPPAPLGGGDPG